MAKTEQLLARINALAETVKRHDWGLGFLGLGSAGREQSRMDQFSDLDFFVIVREEAKPALLENCHWMEEAFPLMWQFRNTDDGYKVLFSDGIYAEFAIFTPEELRRAVYAPGRFIWRDPSLDPELESPAAGLPDPTPREDTWLIGEILTCLYVGLARYYRGERLSAMVFIQQHAFSMLLELIESVENTMVAGGRESSDYDVFGRDRRLEQRQPELIPLMKKFLPGYENSVQAAREMLEYMTGKWDLPKPIVTEIRELLERN
jgi:lincosamide nucleotidyltransferase